MRTATITTGQERVGLQLRTLRQSSKLGQKAIAKHAGISVSHVSLIEHGQRSASINVLCALANAVGADVVLVRRV